MKRKVTVELLKELAKQYVMLENDEMEESTDWGAYCFEPELLVSYEVTLEFLRQIELAEFETVASHFEAVVRKFQSMEIIEMIEQLYTKFYGENRDTEFYQDNIFGLENCIRKK